MIEPHLVAAYESCAPRMPGVTLERFVEMVADWRAVPVVVGGQAEGALLIRGPEIHACVRPAAHRRWVTRSLLGVLDQVIEQHGLAVTSVDRGRPEGLAFVKRLGFNEVGASGDTVIFEKR